MVGLLRLLVFGFLALSVVYLAVWVYSRSVRREKLEKRWDAEHPEGGDEAARSAYIEKGMQEYLSGIRPKLILLVYVVPVLAALALIYLINFY